MSRIKNFKAAFIQICISLILIMASCSSQAIIEKTDLPQAGNSRISSEISNLVVLPEQDHSYFHLKTDRTTYKSILLNINQQKIIDLETKLQGDIGIYFEIKKIAGKGQSLNFEFIKKNSGQNFPILKYGNLKKNTTILKNITLRKGDSLQLKFSGTCQAILSMPILFRKTSNNKKKFIFLISVDTLRADYLEIYGSSNSISKNISKFSKNAVVFEHCYAQSSWTLPSHMSIFTGLNVFNHGIYNKQQKLSKKIPVLTESLFKDYFNFSYNDGLFLSFKHGFYRGFDFYSSQQKNYQAARLLFSKTGQVLEHIAAPYIFSFLHTYQVHSPYRLHPGLPFSDSLYRKKHPLSFSIPLDLGPDGHRLTYRPFKAEKRQEIISLYNAEIEFFDHWFGKFLTNLKKKGIYDQSMIILLSDHGEEFFDHGGWGHGHTLYNEIIKVPLIIKFPRQEFAGKRIFCNVALIDVFPSILDYYGIPYAKEIDGRSLMNVVRDNSSDDRGDRVIFAVQTYVRIRDVVFKFPQKVSAIYKNFKLIYNFKYNRKLTEYYSQYPLPAHIPYELYDMARDKEEKQNLIQHEKFIKISQKLKKEISRILKKIYKSRNLGIPIEFSAEDVKRLKTLGYL